MLNLPQKLQPFSKSCSTPDFDAWIHFYEDDHKFSKFRKNPESFIDFLKKFPGVITTDVSIGWCDPIEIQKQNAEFNAYCWDLFQKNGINCIRNVRLGDANSYDFCLKNVPSNSILAVGSHGTLRRGDYRIVFEAGLNEIVSRKHPHTLLVYGRTPFSIFKIYIESGIKIVRYPSECELAHGGCYGT